MTAMEGPIPAEQLKIVPANEASWDDLAAMFGMTDYPMLECQAPRGFARRPAGGVGTKVPTWLSWRAMTLPAGLKVAPSIP